MERETLTLTERTIAYVDAELARANAQKRDNELVAGIPRARWKQFEQDREDTWR